MHEMLKGIGCGFWVENYLGQYWDSYLPEEIKEQQS